MALYSKYIIPFELASVVLLVALVGAIILAKKDEEGGGKRMSSVPLLPILALALNFILYWFIWCFNKTKYSHRLNFNRIDAKCRQY